MMAMQWARGLGVGLLAWWLGVALQLQQIQLWPAWGYAALLALALFPTLLKALAPLSLIHI